MGSPYTKAVRSVIRLVAAAFIVSSLCWYLPDLYLWLSLLSADKPPRHTWILVLKGFPFVIGVVILWKSDDIAKRLTKDLD